jgi:hypothetical protein
MAINGSRQPKKCGAAMDGLHWPKEKIAARQSGYCDCLFKICGTTIRVSCLPLQKCSLAIRVLHLPLQNLSKAWVLRGMVGARLEGCAKWLAQGLRIVPNGWRKAEYCTEWWGEANIALDGDARLISCLMVAQG